jgi:hypothetical protein
MSCLVTLRTRRRGKTAALLRQHKVRSGMGPTDSLPKTVAEDQGRTGRVGSSDIAWATRRPSMWSTAGYMHLIMSAPAVRPQRLATSKGPTLTSRLLHTTTEHSIPHSTSIAMLPHKGPKRQNSWVEKATEMSTSLGSTIMETGLVRGSPSVWWRMASVDRDAVGHRGLQVEWGADSDELWQARGPRWA